MPDLPRGTVTFLFTDIEGSTRLWELDPAAMWTALARHHDLLRSAILVHHGVAFKTVGDAFQAAFASAPDAVAAAADAQRTLAAAGWPETGRILVRMAIHSGEAEPDGSGGDYTAPCLNRLARLLGAAHGGQTVLTGAARALVEERLPSGVSLKDLGRHRLRDLLEPERVTQVDIAGLTSTFPPLKSLERHPTNLPVQPTALIGRGGELAAIAELFGRDGARLVTLNGPGGAGKTRLALQAAAGLLDAWEDGAFFVDLAPLFDPGLLLSAVAQALGVREGGGQTVRDALTGHLGGKRILLILDNFERVAAAAPDVADLLASCPRLGVIVTSRAPLRIRAEREVVVDPFGVPDLRRLPAIGVLAVVPAIDLFVQRARAAQRDFRLTPGNADDVAATCVALDGLPLAIELAAARIRLLTPAAMRVRLERRLALLTGGARDLPERQRTLRAAIAWSRDLLSPAERTLFAQLSVFSGGCTLEAAEAVAGGGGSGPLGLSSLEPPTLDGLSALVEQSLLRQREDAEGQPRFTVLATIREFA
ncbi:MAG: AAA family ATPase [Thermomicrobiales bacterium]